MTSEEKIKYVDAGLRGSGINCSPMMADAIIQVVDLIKYEDSKGVIHDIIDMDIGHLTNAQAKADRDGQVEESKTLQEELDRRTDSYPRFKRD